MNLDSQHAQADTPDAPDTPDTPDAPVVGHIVSFKLLLAVIACLLVLTWMTVVVAHYELGPMSVWVAIGIAAVKATLVSMYFMHLRYDTAFHGLIFYLALGFVVLFIFLTTTDTGQYQDKVDAFRVEPTIAATQ